jgi:hypothetical protein
MLGRNGVQHDQTMTAFLASVMVTPMETAAASPVTMIGLVSISQKLVFWTNIINSQPSDQDCAADLNNEIFRAMDMSLSYHIS